MATRANKPADLEIRFSKNDMTTAEIDSLITSRCFDGQPSMYNSTGATKFSIKLEEDFAYQLKDAGWNVSIKEERRNEDGVLYGYLPVFINFGSIKNPVNIIQAKKKTNGKYTKIHISENTVKDLQSVRFMDVKMSITASYWERPDGSNGYKAYLSTMLFEAEPVKFEDEYDWDIDDDDTGLPFEC